MKALNNLKIGVKLIGSFLVIALILVVLSVLSYTSINSLKNNMAEMYHSSTLPIQQIGAASSALYKLRGDIYKFILLPDERSSIRQAIEQDFAAVNEQIDLYRANQLTQEETEALKQFDNAWTLYQRMARDIVSKVESGDDQAALDSIKTGSELSSVRKALDDAMNNLIEINRAHAEELDTMGDNTVQNILRILIIASVVGVLLAMGLGLVITRSINTPLAIMAGGLQKLAQGDLNRDIAQEVKDAIMGRRDEIGIAGKGLGQTELYLQEMAEVASRIASGDLTVKVTPKCEKDELGHAFVRMLDMLLSQVTLIAESANNLSSASVQLASASDQSGQATNQIATTIQQVAKGTAQQSESITRTAASVEQMSRAIDGVAKGAQEQAAAVAKASSITSELSDMIKQVEANAQESKKDSSEAAQAASHGNKTVQDTIQGMQNIKTKVEISAQKMQEMNKRSEQIGAIVEAIEDIASQTNLLALNAAIEAARAGEHGKGFAVVADEVRKLAERASDATKEIGNLIKSIQHTVTEAVEAMEAGAKEVDSGVSLANSSGQALSEILQAIEAVYQQAQQSAQAAEKMTEASNQLVAAMDAVSAVVEENTAATEEMAASSHEVTQAIENIASVSEENSAAIEQVSASAEEMNAQVEEVTASAQSLEEMARALQQLVAQFKLEQEQKAFQSEAERPTKYVGPDRRKPAAERVKAGNGSDGQLVKAF